jgi:hypothetical protein
MGTSPYIGDAKALQSEHLDQRNRSRMEDIERSSQKPISHLGALEIKELAMEGRERVPLEEKDHGELPCLP